LISKERQDIDERIRAHGLDPASFGYRVQASDNIMRYVSTPKRVFGSYARAEALALYPKSLKKLYITFERDLHIGFRSSFRPDLNNEKSASMTTWAQLMDHLDRWLDRLVHEEGLQGDLKELPSSKGRSHHIRPDENHI
jgi:hypothetical protein